MYTLKTCSVHIGNVLFAFCLFDYFLTSIQYMLITPGRGHWFLQANVRYSCTKHQFSWRKWQQWVFINVMYYSTAFLKCYFQRTCLTFLPFVSYIFLLEWSCRANKAALFFTYSHFNLLFKYCLFHLSHFDSLSLQIIIKKNIF